MTTSNLIELPTQLILVDTPLLPDSTNEVLTYAKDLGKPTSRVYVSHGHPDHFAGAGLVGAPLYALPSVAAAINNGGGAIIRGALALTGHGRIEPGGLPRIGHHVAAGEDRIDGARVRFEPVSNAEGSEQLTIGFPGDGILIVQDLVYNRVHAFLGEQHSDGWLAVIAALEARSYPYAAILPGHGLPGARGLYGDARACLTAAPALGRRGRWPRRPQPAPGNGVPGYGGTTMRPLQNYFPHPGPSLTHSHEQPG